MLTGELGFSQKLKNITTAASMDIAEKARQLKSAGEDVIDLSSGEPDFDTPVRIKDACKKALDDNLTHYSASRGIESLRKFVCNRVKEEHGLDYSWKDNIIITPGAKQAVFYSLFSLLNAGDEVLIPEPYWLSYKDAVALAGGVVRTVVCSADNGFRLKPEDVEKAVTAKTKILLLNNPCNPTGVLLNKDELSRIASVVNKKNIFVISDEIYDQLRFDGREFTSFAALPQMFERTLLINGLSKTYAMTGWRLGYVLAGKAIIDQINKIHQHIATCAGTFIQYAAAEALRYCDEDILDMRNEYQRRRDTMVGLIRGLGNISCVQPEGTFYCWVDIRKTGHSSVEFSNMLLDKAKVASVPGIAYGKSGEGYIRLAFTRTEDRIREGISRMKEMTR